MDEPDAPDPRSMTTEGLETLEAYEKTAPKEYELESTWRPKYAELNYDVLAQMLPKYAQIYKDVLYPASNELANQANTSWREGQVNDIQNLGGAAVSAIKGMDPETAQLMSKMSASALEGLEAGGGLTARESYDASQAARAAGAARGNVMGNSTVFNELLNNETLAKSREDRARNFAATTAQMNYNAYTNPALQAVSGISPMANTNVSGQLTNLASGGQTSSGKFNPWTNYASNLYGQNYATAYDYYLQNRDQNEQLVGTILGTAGAAVGGVFGGPMGAAAGGAAGEQLGSGIGMLF